MGQIKRHALLALILLIPSLGFSGVSSGRLNIEEVDGTPSTYPYKLKVTNGSLTDNADGTASLSTGSGSSGPVKIGSGTIGGFDVTTTSATVTGSAGLAVHALLDVDRPDLTGFSGGSRLYFDPAAANSLLRLESHNNTSTSNTISFRNASSLNYATIDMGYNALSGFELKHSSVTPDGVASGIPVSRWTANPAGSQIFSDHTGTAVFTIDKSSISTASFNATATSATVTGSAGLTVTNLTSGRCVETGTGGVLTAASAACSTGGSAGANLNSYRRPNLQYVGTSSATIETGCNGVIGQAAILFPDGSYRTDSTSSHIICDSTRTAVLTGGGVQSGLDVMTFSSNTFYTAYAVKSQANSTDFVCIMSTLNATTTNYALINTRLGTQSWVNLGVLRIGDQGLTPAAILQFVQAGNETYFYNSTQGANFAPGTGMLLATSPAATSIAYNTSYGVIGAKIPENFVLVEWYVGHATYRRVNDNTFSNALETTNANFNGIYHIKYPPKAGGITVVGNTATTTDIFLSGWVDATLGVGSNPNL